MLLALFFIISLAKAKNMLTATGSIVDSQGISIAGVYVKLYQQQAVIAQTQSKNDGQYLMNIDVTQIENQQFMIEATLVEGLMAPIQLKCNPISSGNEFTIKQDIKLTVDDITVNGPAVIAKIIGQYYNKASSSPLSDVTIKYEIDYQDKVKGISKFEFPSTSDQLGQSKLFTIYPKGPGAVKFLAQKENFWNFRQTKEEDKFTLIVMSDYKVMYEVNMEEGQFTEKITGTLVDKNSAKPLKDVNVVISFSSKSKGLLDKKSQLTTDTGQFTITYQTKLWFEFKIQIEFLKDYYAHNEMGKTIEMDHDDHTKIADNWDLGIIKLPVQPHIILFGDVIDPYEKPVANLLLKMIAVYMDIKTEFQVTTDSAGKWKSKELLLEPSSTYSLLVKYMNKEGNEISNKFTFRSTAEPQQSISIMTVYYQGAIMAEISGQFNTIQNMLPLKIPVIVNCGSDASTSINGVSDFNESFDVKWQAISKFDEKLSCQIFQGKTTIIQPFLQKFELKAPTWKIVQNINLQYNLFKEIITGLVKDEAQLVKFIGDAKLTFKLYQKDETLHTQPFSRELVSDVKDGTFTFQFLLANGEKSAINVQAKHPDFQDFSKDDFITCDAEKDETLNKEIVLKRIELSVILNYKTNTISQPATLQIKTSKPFMQYEKLYSQVYKSNDGTFKMSFTCYQNVDYTATLELTISSFTSQMYTSNTFKCVPPTKEKPEIELTSQSLFISGIFTIKFLDVNNKAISNIEAKFTSDPISETLTVKSGDDGVAKFTDTLLMKNQQYKGTVQYKNTAGEQQSATITFFPTENNFVSQFPDQYLGSSVVYTIGGKVTVEKGSLVTPAKVTVSCDNSITASGVSQLDGTFSITFSKTSNFNDILKCKTEISGDVETKSFESTFTKGKYTDYQVVKTSFKEVQLNVNGKLIDPVNNPKRNLPVNINFEVEGIIEKQASTTNEEGVWQIKAKVIHANQQYTLKLIYKNGAQQEISVAQRYTSSVFTLKPVDDFTFPISYYQDFEECHISGNINKPNNLLPVTIPLKYTCNSIQKDTKAITNSIQSSFESKYNLQFDGLVEFDQPLSCDITSGNEKIAKLNQKVELEGPKWEIIEDLSITFVTWKILINGNCLDSTDIDKNLKDAKIKITVHQKSKVEHKLRGMMHLLTQNTDFNTISLDKGQYEFNFVTLNEELISVDIYATHIDFIDFSQLNAIQISGSKDEELKYPIKLQRVQYPAILGSVPEESGTIYLKDTTPRMNDDKLYNVKTNIVNGKPFQLQFQCYQNIEYIGHLVIENEHKQNIEYVTQPFKCKRAPEVTQLTLRSLNDKITIDLTGKITDKEKIIDFVEGATIKFEILKDNKLVTQEEIQTSKQGTYKKQFTLRKDSYSVKFSITHPQFIEQSLVKEINLSANSEIVTDFILERVIMTQKIKINLKDGKKTPIKGSEVTASGFHPKPHEKVVVKGENSGVATIEVQCYKGVAETFNLEIRVQQLKEMTEQSISCDGTNSESSIIMKSQYISISGTVIDPYGKGKGDLDMKLITEPASQSQNMKTIKGDWNSELLVEVNTNYKFIISYLGWNRKTEQEEQKLQITSDESNVKYHTIYYKDEVESNINGFVETKKYHISLKSHKLYLLHDDKEITNVDIDQYSEYSIKFKFVAAFNEKYEYDLMIKENQKLKQSIVPVKIVPPKYNMKVDIIVEETDVYIAEIKNHFSKFLLKGFLGSEYNCKDKIHRAVQHASISIIKKGQGGEKIKAATHTADDGKFQLYFFLSKTQVENNIIVWLQIQKEGFITPSPQLIMPSQFERFQMDDETITSIDIGYQSISPIHDMGCPNDLPTLTSDEEELLINYISISKKLKSSN